MLVLRVMVFIWPFLKEMILGDKSLKDAIKQHKGRVFIIGVIFLSVFLNFFTIPKLVKISSEYVELKKKYIDKQPPPALSLPNKPTVATAVVDKKPKPIDDAYKLPSVTAPTKDETKGTIKNEHNNTERYRKMKESFDKIKAKEEKEPIPPTF